MANIVMAVRNRGLVAHAEFVTCCTRGGEVVVHGKALAGRVAIPLPEDPSVEWCI